jgi:ABC-2 type transport system ATP-binding protein
MNMIEVDGLTKRFKNFTAVDHISFQVKKGQIFGFLGPNGAGKTTTIRMLCTLLRPTEGSASVAGFDIVKRPDKVREHIGLVAEKLILYDQLTATENLKLFGRLNNLPEKEIKAGTEKWLKSLHMEQWRNSQVGTFSTGMKQRINIARALLHHPDVLILDEPTLGLDPQTTRAIHEFILDLSREEMTILLTTHDMNEADSLSHEIAIIDQARIVATDTPRNLKNLVNDTETQIIKIEVANLSDAMLASLKNMEGVVSVVESEPLGLRIQSRGENAVGNIVSTISGQGGRIRAMNMVEPNLEDVFLHFTGREMRDRSTSKVAPTQRLPWRRRSSRVR